MDKMEFNEYVTRYYRSPNPSLAPAALQWFASSQHAHDPFVRGPVQYFFSRLLEIHPELRDAISRARSEVPRDQPPVIAEVLAATEPPNKIENAIDRSDLSPQINDLLWAEFSLTGQPPAVERLIDLLDRPDLVRDKIETWLKSDPVMRSLGKAIRNRKYARLRSELGIDCDPTNQLVKTPGDLDCHCFLNGLEIDKLRSQRALMLLPFQMTAEDKQHMAGKATAKWSLASWAREESEVRAICKEQIDRRTGRTQLSLLEIVAVAYAAQRQNALASELATRYLALDPNHSEMRSLLRAAKSRLELEALMRLTLPGAPRALADPAGTAKQCLDATEAAWSYRTRYVARGPAGSEQESWIEWNMEYCDPGRFHVTQEAQPSGDYDEWIAIAEEVWRQPFWFHRSGLDLTTGEHHLNIMLSAQPYLELLSKMEAKGGFTAGEEGRSFAILEFIVEARNEQTPTLAADETKAYRVWIDQKSGLLFRVDILLRTSEGIYDQPSACHVFASYNEQLSIEPPQSLVEPVSR